MYSELVAVDVNGSLRQWRWTSAKSLEHPKVKALNLDKAKVRLFVCFPRFCCFA